MMNTWESTINYLPFAFLAHQSGMFFGMLFVMSMAAAKAVAIQRKISKDFMVITQEGRVMSAD